MSALSGLRNFSCFKQFEAFPFSQQKLKSLTAPLKKWAVYNKAPDPADQISALLASLGCLTIIVEKNYTDRDYKAEFSALYAKRFYTPPPRCDRLHFFSQSLSVKKLSKKIDQLKNDSYLGYCVIRPTEFNRVGRTVIRPASSIEQIVKGAKIKGYITCREPFEVHILGKRFEVVGFPFIQQDTQVGVCAHAALWMIGRYMYSLGYCHQFLPPEINIFAKTRQAGGRFYPAEQGLTNVQILDALHGMGLSAIHYHRQTLPEQICKHIKVAPDDGVDKLHSKKLADLAYRYVESRLPVLFTTQDHAVVAVGHTHYIRQIVSNNIDQIPSYLINDDNRGPYVELPIIKRSAPPGQPQIKHSFEDVKDVIAILPGAVMLTGESAEESARTCLEYLPELFKGTEKLKEEVTRIDAILFDYWLRTYLLPASEFQRDLKLAKPEDLEPEVASALNCLDYPQYLWISEIYVSEDEGRPRCIGKIVLDSTAARSDRSVIAIVLRKTAVLFDRRNPSSEPYMLSFKRECNLVPKQMGLEMT